MNYADSALDPALPNKCIWLLDSERTKCQCDQRYSC